jgi:hypothetical protein
MLRTLAFALPIALTLTLMAPTADATPRPQPQPQQAVGHSTIHYRGLEKMLRKFSRLAGEPRTRG